MCPWRSFVASSATRGCAKRWPWGSHLTLIAPEIWPMALFALVVIAVGMTRFRQTLD